MEAILWGYGKLLISQFDAVVAPTRTIAKIVYGRTKITPHAISNGVDLKLFKPGNPDQFNDSLRKKLDIPCDAPLILHVGRLDSEKQVDVAITACAQLLKQTNAHLLVVGDGQERARLTRLSEDMGIDSKCHFTGFLSIADGLNDIYRLATAFVITSQIETQGIVLLEAAASGVPIVAIHSTCIPEIVIDGVNGYLVSPDELENIGSHLLQLIQNPGRARGMGIAGRKIALNHSVEKSMDIYEKLLFKCYESNDSWRQRKRIEHKPVSRYHREMQK
jgi:1,2-diacylglycerol 3-alpha-glucosyltransferase